MVEYVNTSVFIKKEVKIVKYKLKRSSLRQRFTTEEKIKALAELIKRGTHAKEIISEVYRGKKVPQSIRMTISAWERAIEKKLAAGDKEAIKLCAKYGLLEEETKKKSG